MQKILHNLGDVDKLATSLANIVKPGMVFALHGDLGAGKTTLTQAVARELGITEPVVSPTFVIQKIYQTNRGFDLVHIDCYRLNSASEALDIGLDELINSENVCFIEWADKIKNILPPDTINVYLEYLNETSRKIKIES